MTADHLIIIGRGKLIADLPTAELIESSGRHDVLLRSPRAAELAGLLAARGATVTRQDDGALVVTGLDAAAIGDLAAARGIALHALVPRQRLAGGRLPGPHRGEHRLPRRRDGTPMSQPTPDRRPMTPAARSARTPPPPARHPGPRPAGLGVDQVPFGPIVLLVAAGRGRHPDRGQCRGRVRLREPARLGRAAARPAAARGHQPGVRGDRGQRAWACWRSAPSTAPG